jgi:hypothetical protein
MAGLTPETFLAVAEMLAGHLRLKDADRWSTHVCRLKLHSFTAEFPEVNDPQLMWAAEQWVQQLDAGFHRFPVWRELMAPLYRCEGGLANRSWGPRPDLPKFVQFEPAQLALLPAKAQSLFQPPDPQNTEAYEVVSGGRPMLAPSPDWQQGEGLTDEQWQVYLQRVDEHLRGQEEEPCSS